LLEEGLIGRLVDSSQSLVFQVSLLLEGDGDGLLGDSGVDGSRLGLGLAKSVAKFLATGGRGRSTAGLGAGRLGAVCPRPSRFRFARSGLVFGGIAGSYLDPDVGIVGCLLFYSSG
jgi:hypothetical protein